MCGISGFLSSNSVLDHNKILNQMNRELKHRGPDACGNWFDKDSGIGLAHTRLSILDLSEAGSQPMRSHSGRYIISYNGEIYNFKELAEELKNNGAKFKGESDTEVLLAGIDYYGPESFVKKAYGMFAFALWDLEEKELYLFRDRLGEKPLYFSYSNDSLIFSSELKSIKKFPGWKNDICRNSLSLYIRYNYVPAPYSIYKNTYKVIPGSYLKVNFKDKIIKQINLENIDFNNIEENGFKYYWDPKTVIQNNNKFKKSLNEKDHLNNFEETLTKVVSEQLRSDVSVGAFLSGGVDSSLIVSTMSKVSVSKVKTFSIGFNEKDMNEAVYAKEIANHLQTEHYEQYVTPKDCLDIVSDMSYFYDEPFADPSQLPTYLVSKLAKSEVTVSLSGDGADELFGGYNRYNSAYNLWKKSHVVPKFSRDIAASLINNISPSIWDAGYGLIKGIKQKKGHHSEFSTKLKKFSDILSIKSELEMYKNIISLCKNPNDIVLNGKEFNVQCDRKDLEGVNDLREKMMLLDMLGYLPDDILTKVDRAGMAVSLESRIPFLDLRIVNLAWNLPMEMKINKKGSKYILRQLLKKHVPSKMFERPKKGFSIPISSWLRNELRDWAEGLLEEKKLTDQGYFNVKEIRRLWLEHLSGKKNHSYIIWSVVTFQNWLKTNVEGWERIT